MGVREPSQRLAVCLSGNAFIFIDVQGNRS